MSSKFKYLMGDVNNVYLNEATATQEDKQKTQNSTTKDKQNGGQSSQQQELQRSSVPPTQDQVNQATANQTQQPFNPTQVAPAMTAQGYARSTGQVPQPQSSPLPGTPGAAVQGATDLFNNRLGNPGQQQDPSFWQRAQQHANNAYQAGSRYAGQARDAASNFYGNHKDTIQNAAMMGAVGTAVGTATAVGMRWAASRKQMRDLLGNHRTRMFECETYSDPEQKKACRNNLTQMTQQQLNSIKENCANTEQPEKCQEEVNKVISSL